MDQDCVSLRQINDLDAHLLVDWRNDPANSRWFPKQDPWTVAGHLNWYNRVYMRDPSQNLYLVYRDHQPIGTVGMTIENGKGELERMMLGDKTLARGGYMRQGMRLLMDAYGLDHYWLRVMPDNGVTISFHKRNGFKATNPRGGEYVNVHGNVGQYLIMERYGEQPWDHLSEGAVK